MLPVLMVEDVTLQGFVRQTHIFYRALHLRFGFNVVVVATTIGDASSHHSKRVINKTEC